jgi:hypothetical protein
MDRRHKSRFFVWTLLAVLGLVGLFAAVGCDGEDGTSFSDAFNSLGDAFSNWVNQVF